MRGKVPVVTSIPSRRRIARLALSVAALLSPAMALGADQAPKPLPFEPIIPLTDEEAAALPSSLGAEAWLISLELPKSLNAGAPAVAQFRLTTQGGYRFDLDYPCSFRPHPSATAKFAAERVPLTASTRKACAKAPGETCQVTLPLAFTPAARTARVTGTLSFSVCNTERCLIQRVTLSAAR